MKKKKLKNFVRIVQGINQTRLSKDMDTNEIVLYDRESFLSDLNMVNSRDTNKEPGIYPDIDSEYILKAGDVVIDISTHKACIVGVLNKGKILSSNFLKVVPIDNKINMEYFLYLYNENTEIDRQKDRERNSNNGMVSRIPVKSIGEIEIPEIKIEEQKKIGSLYISVLKLKTDIKKYSEILEKLTKSLLEEVIRKK